VSRRRHVVIMGVEIPEDAPSELKDALARRNRASLTGVCECGARAQLANGGSADIDGIVQAVIEHENGCPASDAAIEAIAVRTGWCP